jgi:predicted ATP-grasp superfamily ATP-dependent carboligase
MTGASGAAQPAFGGSRAVVLVTDGDTRAALAATRCLVRAGYCVYVTERGDTSLAAAARGARALVAPSDPLAQPRAYAGDVARLADRIGARVVLPVTDASVDAILNNRELLPPHATLPMPHVGQYECASDKTRMTVLAREAGFAVPHTLVIESPDDTLRLPEFPGYPAYLKPRASVVAVSEQRRHKLGVIVVDSAVACRDALRTLPPAAFPAQLQSRVHGPGEGLFLLRWNGAVLAEFAHRRLRELPPSGGVSVYRESIALDPELAAAGRHMLDALDWQGVAMIECKRDLATGRPTFMEINGRLWGSLQLAIDAGVPFPSLLVSCALGQHAPPVAPYRIGVRSRWFWGEMDHLYARMRRSRRTLHLDRSAPTRTRTVLSMLLHRPGRDRWEVARLSDPAPFLLETARRLRLAR